MPSFDRNRVFGCWRAMMGRIALILALPTLYFSVSAYAEHGKDSLRIIADTDTPIPGGGGNTFQTFFALNGVAPDISGRNIVFGGCCPTGVYSWFDGELGVIADLNSTFPGSEGFFGFDVSSGSSPSISGKNVVFFCRNGGVPAICTHINGSLQSIAEGGVTFVPGTGEKFGTFFMLDGTSPSISGENVAFPAGSDTRNGIYARINGQLITIADNTTPVPGQPGLTFQNFGQLNGLSPSISGENVAFFGFWFDGGGVYAHINGELRVIADSVTNSKLISDPSISDENVAFLSGALVTGISVYSDGQLQVIVDSNTPTPGGKGTFGGFLSPDLDGENIGWGGGANNIGEGIFAIINSEFQIIADRNTIVPGHDDTTFEGFGGVNGMRPSISGENVVFYGIGQLPGKNNKSTNGIYARIHDAPIPTASTWGLIALTLLLLSTGTVLLRRRPEPERSKSTM